MEIALLHDGEGPEFAKVTKQLGDANALPLGTVNDNPVLDTHLYEVEYLDGHKVPLSANSIAENLLAQKLTMTVIDMCFWIQSLIIELPEMKLQ